MTLKVVFLAGPGGVGKTSVSLALLAQADELCINATLAPSTTRRSHAEFGGLNEQDTATLTPERMRALQDKVFADYRESLAEQVTRAKANGTELLVIDRSPYDYASYYVQNEPTLVLEQVVEKLALADSAMQAVADSKDVETYMWLFTFPTSWSASSPVSADDGWRRAPAGKNWVWSALIEQLVDKRLPLAVTLHKVHAKHEGTPAYRAAMILATCGLRKGI